MKAGVLALQGDFREHAASFALAGATPVEVRTPADLADVDCLAIPGGESTTIGLLARSAGLVEPIRERAAAGMPMLGTCAGMIVLAREVEGGAPLLGLLDAPQQGRDVLVRERLQVRKRFHGEPFVRIGPVLRGGLGRDLHRRVRP